MRLMGCLDDRKLELETCLRTHMLNGHSYAQPLIFFYCKLYSTYGCEAHVHWSGHSHVRSSSVSS